MSEGTLWVGIDLSQNSPGLALYQSWTQHLILVCWQQRKTKDQLGILLDQEEQKGNEWVRHVTVKRCEFPFQSSELEKRDAIINDTCSQLLEYYERRPIAGAFEAYGPIGLYPSFPKLAETKGALKQALWSRLRLQFSEVSVGTIKARFGGHGHCTKWDMWLRFHTHFELPNLFTLLNVKVPQNPKKGQVKIRECPCPVQDLVDATGIIFCLLYTKPTKGKKGKKGIKRKREK